MERRWFTISETSAYFSLKKSTLYSLIGRGMIRDDAVLRLGRQIRLDIKKIEQQKDRPFK